MWLSSTIAVIRCSAIVSRVYALILKCVATASGGSIFTLILYMGICAIGALSAHDLKILQFVKFFDCELFVIHNLYIYMLVVSLLPYFVVFLSQLLVAFVYGIVFV